MKKAIFVLSIGILSIFGGNDIYAQAKKDPATRIENRIKKMDEQLNLTDAQEAKMRDLFNRKMQAKEQQKAQRKAYREEMKTILTAEQWKKLEEMKAEKKASKKGKKK
ncbi:MAG: hypothetical protein EOP53_17910 [Sphingobacteriales bacterium]|nr:MAG: hypothetical protein EOP53_17910 [Sphingobacteriales bacterium]